MNQIAPFFITKKKKREILILVYFSALIYENIVAFAVLSSHFDSLLFYFFASDDSNFAQKLSPIPSFSVCLLFSFNFLFHIKYTQTLYVVHIR